MLHWNKVLWLDVASHVTISNQSQCFISALVHGIGSASNEQTLIYGVEKINFKLDINLLQHDNQRDGIGPLDCEIFSWLVWNFF